jgi:hypothetical protein
MYYPSFHGITGNSTVGITTTLTRLGLRFQIPATGTIDTISFTIGSVSAPQTLRAGIYTLDSSGNPTSTAYGGMGYVTQASPTATNYTLTLSPTCSATKGDFVAVVIEWDASAGTNVFFNGLSTSIFKFPAGVRYNGSAWTVVGTPSFAVGYSGTYYDIGVPCFASIGTASVAVNTGSADEYAMPLACTFDCRAAGIWAYFQAGTAADFEAILYEGTTARATATVDGDLFTSTPQIGFFKFATPYELAAGTTYYLAIRPTTTTASTLSYYVVSAAGHVATFGGTDAMNYITRLDQGSWASATTTRKFPVGLIIDKIDDGAGGGGGSVAMPVSGSLCA